MSCQAVISVTMSLSMIKCFGPLQNAALRNPLYHQLRNFCTIIFDNMAVQIYSYFEEDLPSLVAM